MDIVTAIFSSVFAVFIVIVVHEWGHFIVARCMGVHVLRFSIGFGRPVWSRVMRNGTELAIGWLPLGGYVRMLSEADSDHSEALSASYSRQSIWRRIAIVLAGPMMNFVFAFLLYYILFLPGIIHVKPVIGRVRPHSLAEQKGLRPLDQIKTIDHVAVKSWRYVIMQLVHHVGDQKPLVFELLNLNTKKKRQVEIPVSQWKIKRQQPDFLRALGIVPYQPPFPPVIDQVTSNSPALKAGLRKGDRILRVDGQVFHNVLEIVQLIQSHPNQRLALTIERAGRQQVISVLVGARKERDRLVGYLGFKFTSPRWPLSMLAVEKYSFLTAWQPAVSETLKLIKFNAVVLTKMLMRRISVHALSGPISIFQMAGRASQENYRVYLSFLAFFSVALGFINLLPIPGLDGGHFFFQLIELIFRRPVSMRIQTIAFQVGLILLIFLVINATVNDIGRLLH